MCIVRASLTRDFSPYTTKLTKVGTSSPLKRDVVKRLKTVALASEASDSAAHGLISGMNKYEALLAGIGTREGFLEVLDTLKPLSNAVVLAKRAIRCDLFVSIQRRPTSPPNVVVKLSSSSRVDKTDFVYSTEHLLHRLRRRFTLSVMLSLGYQYALDALLLVKGFVAKTGRGADVGP